MKGFVVAVVIVISYIGCTSSRNGSDDIIRVGAKHFNEGYVLGEMIAILLEDKGYEVERIFNLGGTAVTFEALRSGEIDVYPEYTGTIAREILKGDGTLPLDSVRERLIVQHGLTVSEPLGFNNTYALLMRADHAEQLHIQTISGLADKNELRVGLSYEFLEREDGWRNLSKFYNLPQDAAGMEHGLAYQALSEESIDVTDAYSTDGEIKQYDLTILRDDKSFFPDYKGVAFYRANSQIGSALRLLENRISDSDMQRMNARALAGGESHAAIARSFLENANLIRQNTNGGDHHNLMIRRLGQHMKLTALALLLAILFAVPLGVGVYRSRNTMKAFLYVTGILQTIPSIALLALMIPVFGIGTIPALVALFLYALLPILRNLMIGLFTIDPELKKIAVAIGLNRWQQLWYVEFPLALPTLLTGIRTAAVISVGTATLAAFIGAGGLGEYIVTGLALNNTQMIITGAVPSALLAILIELAFEVIERLTVPKHLRQKVLKN